MSESEFQLGDGKGIAMSSWQLIFKQSRVNNGAYDGDRLPAQNWYWPGELGFKPACVIFAAATYKRNLLNDCTER
jgi:hypothetical protein